MRRAAEGGLGLAMSRLATILRNGKGVPRDDAAASLWYRQAINASNEPAAHCRLGQMLWERTAFPSTPQRSALEEAAAHFRAAAAGGSSLCHYNVGVLHLKGHPFAVKDEALALRWLERASTGEAMHAVAAIHADAGRLGDAERWLRRAERAGVEGMASEIARLRAYQASASPAATSRPAPKNGQRGQHVQGGPRTVTVGPNGQVREVRKIRRARRPSGH